MRFAQHELIFKALVALDETAELSRIAPVQPTAGLRFILAWLYAQSRDENRSVYDEFWAAVQNEMEHAYSEEEARYLRTSQAQTALGGISRKAGIEMTVEVQTAMMLARMPKNERIKFMNTPSFQFSQKKRAGSFHRRQSVSKCI